MLISEWIIIGIYIQKIRAFNVFFIMNLISIKTIKLTKI